MLKFENYHFFENFFFLITSELDGQFVIFSMWFYGILVPKASMYMNFLF